MNTVKMVSAIDEANADEVESLSLDLQEKGKYLLYRANKFIEAVGPSVRESYSEESTAHVLPSPTSSAFDFDANYASISMEFSNSEDINSTQSFAQMHSGGDRHSQTSPQARSHRMSKTASNQTCSSRNLSTGSLGLSLTSTLTDDSESRKSSAVSQARSSATSNSDETTAAVHTGELEIKAKEPIWQEALKLTTYNSEGQLTGTTVHGIILQLTLHDSPPDTLFSSAFFQSFRKYSTPSEISSILIERYNLEPASQDDNTVEWRIKVIAPVRLRVYNVFKTWLENHWIPEKDSEALPIIKEFKNSTLHATLPNAANRLNMLINNIEQT